jgi:hypothetical protein
MEQKNPLETKVPLDSIFVLVQGLFHGHKAQEIILGSKALVFLLWS